VAGGRGRLSELADPSGVGKRTLFKARSFNHSDISALKSTVCSGLQQIIAHATIRSGRRGARPPVDTCTLYYEPAAPKGKGQWFASFDVRREG
jgi:hypothetical protein